MNYFSEEDAQNVLNIPVARSVTVAAYADLNDIIEAEAAKNLDGLAGGSLICRTRRDGESHYSVMTAIPGFWEWHELWEVAYGTPESVRDFSIDVDNCWGEDRPAASLFRPLVHVQACDNAIVHGDTPLFSDIYAVLECFEHFGVMDRQCRTKRISLGTKTPEECGRMEICVSMGEIAEFFCGIGIARELTREEARKIIDLNVEEGNTIEGYCTKSGGVYCACNMNICLFANAYKNFGGYSNSQTYLSDLRFTYDTDNCIQCGSCLKIFPVSICERGTIACPYCGFSRYSLNTGLEFWIDRLELEQQSLDARSRLWDATYSMC